MCKCRISKVKVLLFLVYGISHPSVKDKTYTIGGFPLDCRVICVQKVVFVGETGSSYSLICKDDSSDSL
ncbi:unnamed protein product, partial [Brenthis ino]